METKSKTRWVKIFVLALVGILVVVGGTYGTSLVLFNLELKKIETHGEPGELETLLPPIPPEENAAPALLETSSNFDPPSIDEALAYGEFAQNPFHADRQQIALVKKWVTRNETVFPLIETAVTFPKCRFDYDYSKPAELELNHLSELSPLADVLIASALLEARKRKKTLALKQCRLVFLLANALKEEPFVVSLLTRMTLIRQGLDCTQVLMNRFNFTKSQEQNHLSELDKINLPWSFDRAVHGERLFGLALFKKQLDMTPPNVGKFLGYYPVIGWYPTPMRYLDQMYYLQFLADIVAKGTHPYYKVAEHLADRRTIVENAPWYAKLSKIIIPDYTKVFEAFTAHMAYIDVARLGIAAAIYQHERNKQPQKLHELVDAGIINRLPNDPFTGAALRYKSSKKKLMIYSVGIDGEDDGGSIDKRSLILSKTEDIVWQLEK